LRHSWYHLWYQSNQGQSIKMPARFKKTWQYTQVALFLGVPLLLLHLPATFFDKGQTLCPSKLFFNVECLGCGITRATMHLLHGDWQTAIYYNMLSIPLLPILVYAWYDLFKTALKSTFSSKKS
jgi:Protein of unknown function (DUF2752)